MQRKQNRSELRSAMEMVSDWREKLTAREWSIANALAEGMSYGEMAEQFHISFHTVASHVKSILRKTEQPSSRRVAAMIRLVQGEPERGGHNN